MDPEERQRAQRRDRMKEEKRRQARRRKQIKMLAPYVTAALLILILAVVLIVKGCGAIKEKKLEKEVEVARLQAEEEAAMLALTPEPTPEPTAKVIAGMMELTVALPDLAEGYEVSDAADMQSVSEENVQSTYVSLINATTGQLIVSRNARERINPASMTKVLTLLVAAENIDDLDALVTVDTVDTDYAYTNDLSIAGFEAGETVTVRDLLYGAILPSGGECCSALARYVAGSEEDFVAMMNDRVAELGLSATTHFTNPAGCYAADHYTTAVDISMIMKAAIENDLARQVLYAHKYTTSSTDQHPDGIELSNWFLRRIEDKYTATEVMGAKTGYVPAAGNCAVSYTIVNGQVYICATGQAHSSWRAIFDHVYIYNSCTGQNVENALDTTVIEDDGESFE